jgi:Fe-S cluster biogenesis protein NfuA
MSLFESVASVLETLRPVMQADGGDVELPSVEHGIVSVRLKGTCLSCPSASMTLKHGIERTLKEKLPEIIHVIGVRER